MEKKVKKIYRDPKYPTKPFGKIPAFRSYEEEAKFWDFHSFTDFEDELEEVDIVFDLEKRKEETLVLRVNKGVKDKLSKVARKKGVNTSTLARIWLTEKLQAFNSF